MNKAELLEILDDIEKQIGALIVKACPEPSEPLSVHEARIRYAEGGLWLRHWIETSNA